MSTEARAGLFEGPGHFRGAPGARALYHPLSPLVGKAIAPLPESSIRQGAWVRDSVQTLPFHTVAYGLGTAEDAGFFGLLYEEVYGRKRIIRKVQFEGPHRRGSSNKILQK